jgi:hypothetical protein
MDRKQRLSLLIAAIRERRAEREQEAAELLAERAAESDRAGEHLALVTEFDSGLGAE